MTNHPHRSKSRDRELVLLLRLALRREWTIRRRSGGEVVKFRAHPAWQGAPLPMEMTDWLRDIEPSDYTVDMPEGTEIEYLVSIQEGTSPYWRGPSARDAFAAEYQATRNGFQPRVIITTV